MRLPFLPRRSERVAALLAVAAILTACGDEPAAPAIANAAPEHAVRGPQGRTGQFVVECRLDHFGSDDPIVHPGHHGMSHLHQFFGAVDVDADSQADVLEAGDTTCNQQSDTAAYWAPVLMVGGQTPIHAIRSVAYYRAGPGVDPAKVSPYPPGLMLIAGDSMATAPQPVSVAAWTCGTGSARSATPIDCSGAFSLRMIVTYPDCWNGVDLASADWHDPARRHAVYSAGGQCPAAYPVHIPQLQFAIDYPPVASGQLDDLTLSSGDIHSAHADFWNTWHQPKLDREVAECIQRDLVCDVSS